MKISDKGLRLIKNYEGWRDKAYRCAAGKLTIGYGHTNGVKANQVITKEQGEAFLKQDLAWAEKVVNEVKTKLLQHQFDALVSLVFNIGGGAFQGSTLLRLLNRARLEADDKKIQAKIEEAARTQFRRWNKIGVKPCEGLTRRRKAEEYLFLMGEVKIF